MSSILDSLNWWPIRLATVVLAGALLLDQCGAYQVDDYARDIQATVQPRTVTVGTRSIPLHWGIDDVGELPAERRGWFASTPDFRERTWWERFTTDDQKARGQTVTDFLEADPPDYGDARRTLYLQPIGSLEEADGPPLETLDRLLTAYFQTPVEVRRPVGFRQLGLRGRRLDSGHLQLETGRLAEALSERLPDDAFGVVGITATDIYPDGQGGFVFGQAFPDRRVAVASFARLPSQDPSTTLARTFGTVSHEIGHLFGIAHCIYFRCNMNAANTRRQMDRQPLHLGPLDLRKLHARLGFDPAERYRDLESVYRQHGLTDAADWITRRLDRLR